MKGLITEEIAHIRGIPRKLIIFLHGYIDNCECLNHRLDFLLKVLTIPPFICRKRRCFVKFTRESASGFQCTGLTRTTKEKRFLLLMNVSPFMNG